MGPCTGRRRRLISLVLVVEVLVWGTVQAQNCSDPPAIGNGYVTSIGPYNDGEAATYTCQQGYSMTGDADAVTCSSGTWVGTRPVCSSSSSSSNGSTVMWVLVGLGCVLLIILLVALIFGMVWCCCWKEPNRSRVVHYSTDEETGKGSTARHGHARAYHTVRVKSTGIQTGPQMDKECTTVVVNPYWRFADSSTQTNTGLNIDKGPRQQPTPTHWSKTNKGTKNYMNQSTVDSERNDAADDKKSPGNGHVTSSGGRPNGHVVNQKTSGPGVKSPPERSRRNHTSSPPGTGGSGSTDKALTLVDNDHPVGSKKPQKEAKQLQDWLPHSKPIRNINTSTK